MVFSAYTKGLNSIVRFHGLQAVRSRNSAQNKSAAYGQLFYFLFCILSLFFFFFTPVHLAMAMKLPAIAYIYFFFSGIH